MEADAFVVAEAVIAFCQERIPPYGIWSDSDVLMKDTEIPLQELANGSFRLAKTAHRRDHEEL